MPDAAPPIQPCEPQRWLELVLAGGAALSFPYAGYGGNRSVPYVTGRRALDVHLVWLVEKGTFPILIADQRILLEPGTLLWIPPGIVHDTVVPGQVVQHGLRLSLMRAGRQMGLDHPAIVVRAAGDLAPLFDQILAEHMRPGPYGEARQRGLVAALAAAAFTRAAEPASVVGGLGEDHRRRLARLVRDHRARPSVSGLARALGLTADYFARAFRRSYGMPPRQWLLQERLLGARLALAQGGPIKAVAHQFGYRDPHLFSRQFRRAFGLSPRLWRRSADRTL